MVADLTFTSLTPFSFQVDGEVDDAAAAVGGVAVGALYRTGSILKVRVA